MGRGWWCGVEIPRLRLGMTWGKVGQPQRGNQKGCHYIGMKWGTVWGDGKGLGLRRRDSSATLGMTWVGALDWGGAVCEALK